MMRALSKEAEKLLRFYQGSTIVCMVFAWVVIGFPSLWALRIDIHRLLKYFTWVGLKYTLFYQPNWPSLGILFCLGMTLYVLISQSRYELFGLLHSEQDLLEKQVQWLHRQKSDHWLRRRILSPKQLPTGSDHESLG